MIVCLVPLFQEKVQSFPTTDGMGHLKKYAENLEDDIFSTAVFKEDYFHRLAEKINQYRKELDKKRRNEGQQNDPNTHS